MPTEHKLSNSDIIRAMVADVPNSTFDTMDRQKSQAVIEKLREKPGDPKLLEQLILGHVALAFSEAIRYQDKHPAVSPHEIMSEAMLTLVASAKAFDPNKNIMFSTYLVRALVSNLRNKLAGLLRTPVHTPTNIFGMVSKFNKIDPDWIEDEIYNNSDAKKYGVNFDRFNSIRRVYSQFLEGTKKLTAAIEEVNTEQLTPADIASKNEEHEFKQRLLTLVKSSLNHLPLVYPRRIGAKYKRVVELVLQGYTLPETAKFIAVSKQTASAYYRNAMNSLLYLVIQQEPEMKSSVKEYFRCTDEDIANACLKHHQQVASAFSRASA